jgi:TPR repeat protein
MLFTGRDEHPRDFPKAARLLRRSATAGYVPAIYTLGLLLAQHPELAHSGQESRALFEEAAGAGSWKASIVLGVLARDGNGEAADPEAAYFHFQVAAFQGGEAAKKLLVNDFRNLSTKLTTAQMKAQASNASVWYEQHPLPLAFVYQGGENWKQLPAAPLGANDEGKRDEQIGLPPAA